MPLPDLLNVGLNVVFVGTAVTASSNEAEAYYATHGNSFYKVLHNVGITEYEIMPANYRDLLNEGVGLTDLVKERDALDNELQHADFDIVGFKNKMIEFSPRVICFNGKLAAAYFILGNKKTKNIHYGIQRELFGNSIVFVAPSTSRTALKYWNEDHYRALANLINN